MIFVQLSMKKTFFLLQIYFKWWLTLLHFLFISISFQFKFKVSNKNFAFWFSFFHYLPCVWVFDHTVSYIMTDFLFRFRIIIWLIRFCIILDLFSISHLFFAFSLYVVRTSVLGMVCVEFWAVGMLIIEVSWLMLILSCCVFTEVAWITNEVWITDESFAVARKGESPSWSFFPNFYCDVFTTLPFLSGSSFKADSWYWSWQISFSKMLDILLLSVSDCIQVGLVLDAGYF